MDAQKQERWQELCKQVQTEKEQEKLTEMLDEINNLLKEKEARSKGRRHVSPQEGTVEPQSNS